MLLNFISFGLLRAFTFCFKTKWIIKHTVINRKKLVFTGKAIALFGKSLLWGFLTVITFGIFGLWVPIKRLNWQNKNTHIKVVGEEENKDKTLWIAIPVAIIGIISLAEEKVNEDNKGNNNENKTEDNKNTEVSDNENNETSENKNVIENNLIK